MADPRELTALFWAHYRGPAGQELPGLEQSLRALYDAGRRAWPELSLTAAAFIRHLAERLSPEGPVDAALGAVHGQDLFLACACTGGAPGSVGAFERALLQGLPGYISHLDPSPVFTDEVRQTLMEKLFVAQRGAPAKIADYSGTGALQSWVRIAALRTALDLRRSASAQRINPEADEDAAQRALPIAGDPEMDYIKERYRGEFKQAFQDAFSRLSSEQRNVLRLHYIDALNIDRIGAIFGVHRSTVARWLSAAAAQILDETRRLLRERLRLSTAEFDSLADVVRSQLDLNIVSCLRENKP